MLFLKLAINSSDKSTISIINTFPVPGVNREVRVGVHLTAKYMGTQFIPATDRNPV